MTRLCPHCRRRVRLVYEGDGVAADRVPVALFDEHDPCPGSYEPVDRPAPTPAAPVLPPPMPAPKPPPPLAMARTGDRALQLLALLAEGPATVRALADRLDVPSHTVRAALQRLRQLGRVERRGFPGVWMVAP